jgi:uncharacterized protein (TIGR00255 family)|tara:strand:- start:597 stop:1451 length:855 start_codon:yes stop_codon:yes gene_type:complete
MISMTGYIKKDFKINNNNYSLVIKSLNSSKGLDLNIKIPFYLVHLETDLRKLVIKELVRGKISLSILEQSDFSNKALNKSKIDSYIQKIKKIMPDVNSDAILNAVVHLPDIFYNQKLNINNNFEKEILKIVQIEVKKLNNYRKKEGRVLIREIKNYIKIILKIIKQLRPLELKRLKLKKSKIYNELKTQKADYSRAKLESEMIYYFEKNDITEERIRLQHHCNFFLEVLKNELVVGKKLNFISQEILREINTIGSKANNFEIQKLVVLMKEQIEKTKEQLLNIV